MTSEHTHEWEYFASAPRCTICEQSIGAALQEAEQQLAQVREKVDHLISTPNMKA